MSKTFGVAGVSKHNGEVKVRFAQDMNRVKVLERNGHTDVQLFLLPTPMTKEDALLWLVENFDSANTEQYLAIRNAQPGASNSTTPTKADKPAPAAKAQALAPEGITKEMLAKKREIFPSHTDEQLAELIRYQMRQAAALRNTAVAEH